jgi:DNA-binding response OmpR family regulator
MYSHQGWLSFPLNFSSPTEYRILEYMIHRPRVIVSSRKLHKHLYDSVL